MPRNKTVNCPMCQGVNVYDLDELKERYGVVYRTVEPEWREYPVTCKHCGYAFKIKVKEGGHGPHAG